MVTQKLYLASDFLACSATVIEVAEFGGRQRIRLDRTLFHPQGGGQKADRGSMNTLPVLDVRHGEGGYVDHFVAGAAFEPGEQLNLQVDQAWRDEGRRWHSAGHLIADCVVALDPSLEPLRGHHWPGEARVEFAGDAVGLGSLSEHLARELEQMIKDDIPFRIVGDPYRCRALQIADYKPVACGGTHIVSAKALAGLHIRKIQQKEGLLRIGYSFAYA